jgi:hypothetical protein
MRSRVVAKINLSANLVLSGSSDSLCMADGAILDAMRSWTSLIVVRLVLITCLVCPVVEMLDSWDHTIQTGNDTEYALVVVALCVGVVYSLARVILKPVLFGLVARTVLPSGVHDVPVWARVFTSLLSDGTGPPPLPLRI